jgi:hypothetical protein
MEQNKYFTLMQVGQMTGPYDLPKSQIIMELPNFRSLKKHTSSFVKFFTKCLKKIYSLTLKQMPLFLGGLNRNALFYLTIKNSVTKLTSAQPLPQNPPEST